MDQVFRFFSSLFVALVVVRIRTGPRSLGAQREQEGFFLLQLLSDGVIDAAVRKILM